MGHKTGSLVYQVEKALTSKSVAGQKKHDAKQQAPLQRGRKVKRGLFVWLAFTATRRSADTWTSVSGSLGGRRLSTDAGRLRTAGSTRPSICKPAKAPVRPRPCGQLWPSFMGARGTNWALCRHVTGQTSPGRAATDRWIAIFPRSVIGNWLTFVKRPACAGRNCGLCVAMTLTAGQMAFTSMSGQARVAGSGTLPSALRVATWLSVCASALDQGRFLDVYMPRRMSMATVRITQPPCTVCTLGHWMPARQTAL